MKPNYSNICQIILAQEHTIHITMDDHVQLTANSCWRLAIAFALPAVLIFPLKRAVFGAKLATRAAVAFGTVNALNYYHSIEHPVQTNSKSNEEFQTQMHETFNFEKYEWIMLTSPLYTIVTIPVTGSIFQCMTHFVYDKNMTLKVARNLCKRSLGTGLVHVAMLGFLWPFTYIGGVSISFMASLTYSPIKLAFIALSK